MIWTAMFCAILLCVQCIKGRQIVAVCQSTSGYNELELLIPDTTVMINNRIWKGRFFYYHSSDTIRTRFIIEETPVICHHIESLKKYDKYIIVDQKPLDSIINLRGDTYDENGHLLTSKEQREKVASSNIHHYWLIDSETWNIWGPLSKDSILMVAESLLLPHR